MFADYDKPHSHTQEGWMNKTLKKYSWGKILQLPMFKRPRALLLALLKIRGTPTSKHRLSLLEFIIAMLMNLCLKLCPVTDLTESCHNHVQHLKELLSFLEILMHKVIRTWKDPVEKVCYLIDQDISPTWRYSRGNMGCHCSKKDPFRSTLITHGYQSNKNSVGSVLPIGSISMNIFKLKFFMLILVLNSIERWCSSKHYYSHRLLWWAIHNRVISDTIKSHFLENKHAICYTTFSLVRPVMMPIISISSKLYFQHKQALDL